MGSVRLYAIGIDEVRDIFSASDELAAALRAIAAARFPSTAPRTPGLLAKLGPLFARAVDAPVIHPDIPTGAEVEALLAGRHVPPDRLPAAWILLETWIDAMAWGYHGMELDETSLRDFDFDLARAGVPVQYDLTRLISTPLGIAMRPYPGLVAGFTRLSHVAALIEAWRAGRPGLAEDVAARADTLLSWLGNFDTWARDAPTQRRPVPDLVTVLRTN